MKPKILSFIAHDGKLLALKSNPHPDHAPEGWYVVTGSVEKGEANEEAVRREVKEETSLDTIEVLPLNWGSVYTWKGVKYRELNFISFVREGEIVLNEEHIGFEWLSLPEFVERINWEDDKEILAKVLEKALDRELYFNEVDMS